MIIYAGDEMTTFPPVPHPSGQRLVFLFVNIKFYIMNRRRVL